MNIEDKRKTNFKIMETNTTMKMDIIKFNYDPAAKSTGIKIAAALIAISLIAMLSSAFGSLISGGNRGKLRIVFSGALEGYIEPCG
jgi:hypothetical protein